MFSCDFCSKSIGPKVKPIMVPSELRATRYQNMVPVPNEDPEARVRMVLKESFGSEMLKEFKQCPECAGLERKVITERVEPVTYSEPLRPTFKRSLGLMAGLNALVRARDKSKRASRDASAFLRQLAGFESRGGKVVYHG